MNGGDVVIQTMLSRGIDTVFYVPGNTNVTVMKALFDIQDKIRAVPTRLESSAAFAADAYSAIRKKPACVVCSRAPGATNASIGVHNAMQASRPLVLVITDIPRRLKGREASQEINYRLMYEPIAKAVFDVNSFYEIAEVVARAIDLSIAGRPGPVVVSASRDILDGEMGRPSIPKAPPTVRIGPDPDAVEETARFIMESKKPVIVAGEIVGFENASAELERFAEATGAGVMTAHRQLDSFRADHPAYFGQLTYDRQPFQEEALDEADLIIGIGTRLDSSTTNNYSLLRSGQKLIMVYPEPGAFSQWQPDIAIGSNVTPALRAIAGALTSTPPDDRLAWRNHVHKQANQFSTPGGVLVHGEIDMAYVVEHFNTATPNDVIMVLDAGSFDRWITRYYRFTHPNTNAAPISGSMGYGVPGGIGAQLANPDATVFVWVGDGGFLMTGNECATIMQEKLPVKLMVCDNGCWGSTLMDHHKRFEGWDFGVRLQSPDFAALGRAYGMPAWSVRKTEEFPAAFKEMMAVNGPSMIHFLQDPRDVTPYSSSSG